MRILKCGFPDKVIRGGFPDKGIIYNHIKSYRISALFSGENMPGQESCLSMRVQKAVNGNKKGS